MANEEIIFSVFTKPWKSLSIWDLGKLVKDMGFDGIEFPLREGFQMEPEQAHLLPKLVQQLADHGVSICSVASNLDEKIFAACAEAGIPLIRIMPEINLNDGYLASEKNIHRYLETLYPLCEKYGIRVGMQQHYGNYIVDSMGLLHVIENLKNNYVGVVWDAAHDALAGQQPELGLDIVWKHLDMIHLKNAFYERTNGPEAMQAIWKPYFTTGRHGLASWQRIADYLKSRQYKGVICLTAEYTNGADVDRFIQEDISYIKSLF
ncbi:sugar phosphate isomerase/epimerase family protein [Paenibacillus yanchengensis]|uniref:Sugar phosphate isomerase/epimerase family protein n=1 Tax=Paenibacillus yanchengensis TaxID=2035833 RepID=A0ABW4YHL1_9BACL